MDNGNSQVICKFKFLCNKEWDDLQIIANENSVRFCSGCLQPVFLTKTYNELVEHTSQSRCVAIESKKNTGREHTLGIPFYPGRNDEDEPF
jgi:hypothetical protein